MADILLDIWKRCLQEIPFLSLLSEVRVLIK